MLFPRRKVCSKQQGVVVVVALLVVALVATMACAMMSRLERDIRRTQLVLRDAQANLYAQGAVVWAIDQLYRVYRDKVVQTPVHWAVDENGYHIVSTLHDFLVKTEVTIEKQHVVLYTRLLRTMNGREPLIRIVWQSKGAKE